MVPNVADLGPVLFHGILIPYYTILEDQTEEAL